MIQRMHHAIAFPIAGWKFRLITLKKQFDARSRWTLELEMLISFGLMYTDILQ
jgi:hypothetical protein